MVRAISRVHSRGALRTAGAWALLLAALFFGPAVWACGGGSCGESGGCAGGFGCGCGCGAIGNTLNSTPGGSPPAGLSAFRSQNIQLRGQLTMQQMSLNPGETVLGSGIWGWHDTETGREYAIYAKETGTSFVDVTNPTNPVYLGDLPSQTGRSIWREVQTYQNYAYIVSDHNGNHGIQIFDLRNLRGVTTPQTFSNTSHFLTFPIDGRNWNLSTIHTVTINEQTAHLYANGSNMGWGGYVSLSLADPLNPVVDGLNPLPNDYVIHDSLAVVYNGLDSRFVGREISFQSMGFNGLAIADITSKDPISTPGPVEISREKYANLGYTHQAYLTEDHRFLIQNDEFDETNGDNRTKTHIWELTDLTNPTYLGAFVHTGRVAIDHNLFIRGNLVYMSNYSDGLWVYDLSKLGEVAAGTRPVSAALELVGFFDTYYQDDAVPETSFNGSWGNYPYLPSGNILVGDRQNGLFVVSLNNTASAPEPATLAYCLLGAGVWLARGRKRRG